MNKRTVAILGLIIIAFMPGCSRTPTEPVRTAQTGPDRTVLPIAEPQYPHSSVLDVRDVPASTGKATIRYEFAYDGGGLGKGGLGRIFVNDKKVAEGRIERTQPMMFSSDEGADVGEDGETPVVEDYGIPAPYQFSGKIAKITVEVQEMKTAEKAEEERGRAIAAQKLALAK